MTKNSIIDALAHTDKAIFKERYILIVIPLGYHLACLKQLWRNLK